MLAVPAHKGLRSARLGGTSSLGYRRAPGACRSVVNGWFGHAAIVGRPPRSGGLGGYAPIIVEVPHTLESGKRTLARCH